MDKVLSFYKGSTVVKHGFKHTGSFFGTIWNGGQNDGNDIKHEYGHSIQERILGPAFYSRIAIPSVITCLCGTHGINYYSMPWERSADFLGGANSKYGYKNGSLAWSVVENILGLIVIPAYFIWGY